LPTIDYTVYYGTSNVELGEAALDEKEMYEEDRNRAKILQRLACLCYLNLSAAVDDIDLYNWNVFLLGGLSGRVLNWIVVPKLSFFYVKIMDSQSTFYQLLYTVFLNVLFFNLSFLFYVRLPLVMPSSKNPLLKVFRHGACSFSFQAAHLDHFDVKQAKQTRADNESFTLTHQVLVIHLTHDPLTHCHL
jgi:hypothetical protein